MGGIKFDGVLVPSVAAEVVEAFRSFRAEVPLRLATHEERVTGIARFRGGEYRSDYRKLATLLSKLLGTAIVVRFTDDEGMQFELFQHGRAVESRGPAWGEVQTICGLTGANLDQIEHLLRGGGETLGINIPSMADLICRLEVHDEAAREHLARSRVALLNRADSVDRMLADGNEHAAAALLRHLLHEVRQPYWGSSGLAAAEAIEATLDRLA